LPSAVEILTKAARRGWHYQRMTIIPWAERHVYMPRTTTSNEGPFRAENAPWEIEPLQEIANDENEAVALIKANQVGGTTVGVISLAYFTDQDPGPAMWTTANQDLARDFSKDSLFPIFRSISAIDDKLLNDRKTASTFELRFPSMTLLLAWGGSAAKAEQKSIRYLYLDEFEKYADLIAAFEARTTRYHNSRKIYISKPGLVKGPSWEIYQTTDQREWHWRCQGCGKPLPLKFKDHIFFDRFHHANSQPDWARIFATIRFICPHCKREHFESPELHAHIAERGSYIPQAPLANAGMKRKRVGFRWNAMLLPLIDGSPSWQFIVKEFIEAQTMLKLGVVLKLQEWTAKRMAEFWEPGQEYETRSAILASYKAAEAISEKWDYIFLTVDVQHHGFWHIVRGWKNDGTSALLSWGELQTWGDITEKSRQHNIINPRWVFLDSRYNTAEVHRRCARNGWTALRAENRVSFPFTQGRNRPTIYRLYSEPTPIDCGIGTAEGGRQFCVEFMFARNTAQGILQRYYDGAAREWKLPADVSDDYKAQLRATVPVSDRVAKTGIYKEIWKDVRPCHMRDCEVAQIVAAAITRRIVIDVGDLPKDGGEE
jgi:hypothetical protein